MDEANVINYITNKHYSERIKFVIYVVENSIANHNIFPMNYLRNIAIKRTTTTHYLVLDIDEFISSNLQTQIRNIPSEILMKDDVAIIIPIVMINPENIIPYCCKIKECIEM